jgi:hypothetical protein
MEENIMGYRAHAPILRSAISDTYGKRPGFFKSLDYGNIAHMAAWVGLGFLAFKSLKAIIYGKAAEAAYEKARHWIH